VRRLKPIGQAHLKSFKHDRCYQLTLTFSTTQQAKQARDRILEEQHGGNWSSFAVALASSLILRSMERPVEAPTPGAAV
jgi:hypothetical protein